MKNTTRLLKIIALIALVAIVTLVSGGRLTRAQRTSKLIVPRTADSSAQDTDTFSPKDHVIYGILEGPNADPKGTYKFIWGRYDPAASTPKTLFQEEVKSQNGRAVSKFSSSSDLPAGEYSVNLWADRPSHARKVFAVKE
jgi:hypothetical protein